MILGDCPYPGCNEGFMLDPQFGDLPVPRIAVHKCHACGNLIHTYVSLLRPESYTEKKFHELYPDLGPEDMKFPSS